MGNRRSLAQRHQLLKRIHSTLQSVAAQTFRGTNNPSDLDKLESKVTRRLKAVLQTYYTALKIKNRECITHKSLNSSSQWVISYCRLIILPNAWCKRTTSNSPMKINLFHVNLIMSKLISGHWAWRVVTWGGDSQNAHPNGTFNVSTCGRPWHHRYISERHQEQRWTSTDLQGFILKQTVIHWEQNSSERNKSAMRRTKCRREVTRLSNRCMLRANPPEFITITQISKQKSLKQQKAPT